MVPLLILSLCSKKDYWIGLAHHVAHVSVFFPLAHPVTMAKGDSVCAKSYGFDLMGHVLRSGVQWKCLLSCVARILGHIVGCDGTP